MGFQTIQLEGIKVWASNQITLTDVEQLPIRFHHFIFTLTGNFAFDAKHSAE